MMTLPTERPVTPLRQRMLDDMAMRAMRSRTQHDYVRHVRAFAAFLGRSSDSATAEDVRRFQLHQREHGVGGSTINGSVSALRFLFDVTLIQSRASASNWPNSGQKSALAAFPWLASVAIIVSGTSTFRCDTETRRDLRFAGPAGQQIIQ